MLFLCWSNSHKTWVKVSHKKARQNFQGRIINFGNDLLFDKVPGGNWSPSLIKSFNPYK